MVVLLTGMLASILDASGDGAADPALLERVFAVLTDGLRPAAKSRRG